jgi:lipopolysaccharide export system protein LptA
MRSDRAPVGAFGVWVVLWVGFVLNYSSIGIMAQAPFEIEADHLRVENTEKEMHASGDVYIQYKTYSTKSQVASYYKKNGILELHDNVQLTDNKKNTLDADSMIVNLNNNTGEIFNGKLTTNRGIIAKADKVDLKQNEITLSKCTITTCTSSNPFWFIQADQLTYNRYTNQFESKHNKLYIYSLPVFYTPIYTQKQGAQENNVPIPEIGYNQVNGIYGTVFYGYAPSPALIGKVGFGVSQKRGFRYGNTASLIMKNDHFLTLKTYHVELTGFEGGLNYQWGNNHPPIAQRLFSEGTIQQKKQLPNAIFYLNYLINETIKNEYYNAIPEFILEFRYPKAVYDSDVSLELTQGYYSDRLFESHRTYLSATATKLLYKQPNWFEISSDLFLKYSNYSASKSVWQQLIQTVAMDFHLFNRVGRVSYSKLFHQQGMSPFVFDTLNAVKDDEVGVDVSAQWRPLVVGMSFNYQTNLNSFRNIFLTGQWGFQCWEVSVGVDLIWDEVRLGVSIPNL